MYLEHPRVTAVQHRVAIRATKHLGPVEGEMLDVRRIEAMREGVADLRLLHAALVVGRRQRKECGVAPGQLVNGCSSHGQ